MLSRPGTLPARFIAPRLPTKTDRLPSSLLRAQGLFCPDVSRVTAGQLFRGRGPFCPRSYNCSSDMGAEALEPPTKVQ
jgi:hypothetical protein